MHIYLYFSHRFHYLIFEFYQSYQIMIDTYFSLNENENL